LLKYTGEGKDGEFSSHIEQSNFVFWNNNIQSALLDDCKNWDETRAAVASDFGWTVDRLGKYAMVVEATLERCYSKDKPIATLEKLCKSIITCFDTSKQKENAA
jgi:hypothetical protein